MSALPNKSGFTSTAIGRAKIKNAALLLASVCLSFLLVIVLAEAVFYFTYGSFYKQKSYLVYKSEFFDLRNQLYDTKLYPYSTDSDPIIVQEAPEKFNIGTVKQKIIKETTIGDGYDISVGMWLQCDSSANAQVCLSSRETRCVSYNKGEIEDREGYRFLLVTVPFDKEARLSVENAKAVTGAKDMRILFNRHPCGRAYAKPKGALRIIALGGSTTAGYLKVDNSQVYPFFLQKYFDALWPGKVDICNLGIIGGQTNDFLNNINFYLALEPDIALIAPVWNDAHSLTDEKFVMSKKIVGSLTYFDLMNYIRNSKFFAYTALGYYVYKIINRKITREMAQSIEAFRKLHYDDMHRRTLQTFHGREDSYWQVFGLRLGELVHAFKSRGVEVVLLTFPCMSTGVEPAAGEKKMLDEMYNPAERKEDFFQLLHMTECFGMIDGEVIPMVAQAEQVELVRCEQSPVFANATYTERTGYFWDHVHLWPLGQEMLGRAIVPTMYDILKDKVKS